MGYIYFFLVIILCLCTALHSEAKQRTYSFRVTIASPEHYKYVPFSIDVDFDQIFAEKGISGTFDRYSVIVKKIISGKEKEVQFNLSDSFLTDNKGRINWLIDDTNETDYVIYFDNREHGPFDPPKCIGLVGNGDCLHYNDNKLHPLHVGMMANPVAVDWNGNGRTDIISPQIYTFTRDTPRFCVKYYENIGSNENPVFGDGIPIRYKDGDKYHFMEAGVCIQVEDINSDGLPDLLTVPYFGGPISIYINTGKKDNQGMPVLVPGGTIPVSSGGYAFIKGVKWHKDNRLSFLVGYLEETQGVKKDDPLWFEATDKDKNQAKWPRWYYKSYIDYYENTAEPGQPIKLKEPIRLKTTDSKDISWYIAASFEDYNWFGRDSHDLLVLCNSGKMDNGYAGLRIYKNVGDSTKPVFEDKGLISDIKDRSFLYVRKVDTPAFKGLLVAPGSAGGKIQYYQLNGSHKDGTPAFKSKGFLMQRGAYLNSYAGYAQCSLTDNMDIILGCETGWITWCKNTGTLSRPVFSDNEFLKIDGKPIEMLNGPFSDPGSFMESPLGQTSPIYIDWDNDGTPDLIIAIAKHFYFCRNTGTAAKPIFHTPVEILTDTEKPIKDHREKPAIIDWYGNGLLDVIGTKAGDMCIYRRYKDAQTGELKLDSGTILKYSDGTVVHPLGLFWNAGDWKSRGVYDLFFCSWDKMYYVENTGTNQSPAFAQPVEILADGQSASVGCHVSTPLPCDFDKTGKLDLIISGESGLIHLFRRNYLDGVHRKIECYMSLYLEDK